jgi:hypothetical protein
VRSATDDDCGCAVRLLQIVIFMTTSAQPARLVFRFFISLGALLLTACATATHDLSQSNQVNGAQGKVSIDTSDEFGNIPMQVEVKNLPPPGRAVPNATTYVVWVRPSNSLPNEPPTEGFPIRNVGALQLERNATGELKTKIEPYYEGVEVFVTAEAQGNSDSPTTAPVFWTHFKLTG